jgi:hypothetical protein
MHSVCQRHNIKLKNRSKRHIVKPATLNSGKMQDCACTVWYTYHIYVLKMQIQPFLTHVFPYRDTLKLMLSLCGKTSITRNISAINLGSYMLLSYSFEQPINMGQNNFSQWKNHRKRWQYIYFIILISIIICSKNIKLYIIHAITIYKTI